MVCRFLGVGSGFVTGFLSGRISRQFLSEIFSQPRRWAPEGGIPRGTMPLFMCLKVKPSNYSTKQKAVIFMASRCPICGVIGWRQLLPYTNCMIMRLFSQHCWMMWAGWRHDVMSPFILLSFHSGVKKQKDRLLSRLIFYHFFFLRISSDVTFFAVPWFVDSLK